ncbi:cell wall integrity and stress response component 1 [Drosophila obscura]|uniref:cell wall integrity and stress response component 1 n=1 Tax=Drosophila obscura TaxID=7282 RepID=UPI001BB2835B|nr:cell wall integrity and stress response component 1 [Drosophila obscura]
MLLVPLALISLFGLAQTLPLDDVESSLSPATSELPDDGGRVVFDQRQSGRYNIHVSIKDVAIIEVGQNDLSEGAYSDAEDYYYDDSALTIKPIKFSTEAIGSSSISSSSSSSSIAEAATTSTTAISSSSSTSTTEAPTTAALMESTMTSEAPLSSLNANSTYSSNLLADIAASRIKPKSRLNNLMIMETPIGGARPTAVPHLPHPRSKDIPIMAAAAAATAAVTRPTLSPGIEYTPPQGHNSPIFKVKVQRSAVPPTKKPARCRSHQTRNAQGKCGDSIYRRLYSMLMGLNLPGLVGPPPHGAV